VLFLSICHQKKGKAMSPREIGHENPENSRTHWYKLGVKTQKNIRIHYYVDGMGNFTES